MYEILDNYAFTTQKHASGFDRWFWSGINWWANAPSGHWHKQEAVFDEADHFLSPKSRF